MAITTVVFDVNETLSDLTPLHRRFGEIGAPDWSGPYWFATTLREGIALAAGGELRPFAEIGRETAAQLLRRLGVRWADARARELLEAFLELPVHPDVHDGVAALRAAGLRLVTLSNGATAVAEKLLSDHGLRGQFDAVLSVEDAGLWKPARAPYEYALRTCGVAASEAVMVAVHPWDLHGAGRVGMATAWLDRAGETWPGHLDPPTHTVRALPELAPRLA
ncbi:haloacid dehalogenase type II [Pseudonocardia sp. C8]|uniref:haloacid dehalogenase type II n=1 Tax=Pseudonocardia sp. C8 TaxID=2762759 RepID=UPI0016424664|nr:haloacid dehalogenase type II [Pseudonocardia sp. C8]MBC3191509.1 haloacid dehalogenase type II [Pseudonocardia sp. C8]